MYILAKLIENIALKLPLNVLFLFGNLIGLILYLNRKKREISFKNIKSVFPEKSNKEIKYIIRRTFSNLGLGLIESLIASRLYAGVKLHGKENITREGGILVAIHEGSWELYNFFIASQLKYKMFAKEQKQKSFHAFLNELREKHSLDVCFSLKDAIRSLNDGYLIGLVVDHGAEDNALMVDFFSHTVPTPKGAVYLAKKLNKKIYPCFGYRTNGFSHVVEIGKPIEPNAFDDHQLLRQLNRLYETYLEKYPWEYLWFYKRFKRKKDLDVLIISDGKTGHLKQSQAFLSILKEENLTIRSNVVEIKNQKKISRFISEICALSAGRWCLGCGYCLKYIIDKDTLRKLKKVYADIVISTGSISAPVNKIFSATLGAKSVVILRPNTPLAKFDLCIIPEHDRILAKNVVTIKGALAYPHNVNERTNECKELFKLKSNKTIAVFIGGYLSDKETYLSNLKIFLNKLKEFSLENDYKILISASRRTQPEIEKIIEEELRTFKNTQTIVYPKKINYDFVFEGFVNLSRLTLVSSESISMISEVLALRKPCLCVLLEKHVDKHKVFLQSLEKDVFFLDNPYTIKEINPRISNVFDHNKKVIQDAIKRLF